MRVRTLVAASESLLYVLCVAILPRTYKKLVCALGTVKGMRPTGDKSSVNIERNRSLACNSAPSINRWLSISTIPWLSNCIPCEQHAVLESVGSLSWHRYWSRCDAKVGCWHPLLGTWHPGVLNTIEPSIGLMSNVSVRVQGLAAHIGWCFGVSEWW